MKNKMLYSLHSRFDDAEARISCATHSTRTDSSAVDHLVTFACGQIFSY